MKLILPFPPSVNTYWRAVPRGRGVANILSKKARAYQGAAKAAIGFVHPQWRFTGPVAVEVTLHRPDRRRRDLDNYLKPLFDAITHAGAWEDDSQIVQMVIKWADKPVSGGKAVVVITEVD